MNRCSVHSPIYCGPPGIGLRNFGRPNKEYNNVYNYFGDTSVYFVRKGRTAIRKACELLEMEPGSEILVPSYNCGSEIDAIFSSGASVALYRIDNNCRIDMEDLVRRITHRTRAIYIIHYFGFPQDLSELTTIVLDKNIPLIEDCALALFSKDGTQRLGLAGKMSIFSFPKSLPVPDGGALIVNDAKPMRSDWKLDPLGTGTSLLSFLPMLKATLLRSLSRWRMYHSKLYSIGWPKTNGSRSKDRTTDREMPEMPSSYFYDECLSNRQISTISGYMLRMFDIDSIVHKRRNNFAHLLSSLPNSSCYKTIYQQLPKGICPLSFPIVVQDRDRLTARLRELSIDALPWWKGYHPAINWREFPEACFLKDNVLTLPIHQNLNDKDIAYIAENFLCLVN
jgi:perosamine synthetase